MYYQNIIRGDSDAGASIVRKDVLHERHRIFKDKMNKWSTMAGTFNTSFVLQLCYSMVILKIECIVV